MSHKNENNTIRGENKKNEKKQEDEVVLLAQTFYLPVAFKFVRKRPNERKVSLLFGSASAGGAKINAMFAQVAMYRAFS